MKSSNIKTLTKLLIIVALVCFIFPFVMVSCSGTSVELSGAELMTKTSFHEDFQFDDDESPNYFLLAAFALGIVGLVFVWKSEEREKGMLYAGVSSIGSATFLLLFRSTFVSFYGLQGYEGRVDIEFRWGWWLSLLAYLAAAATSFYAHFSQQVSISSASTRDDKQRVLIDLRYSDGPKTPVQPEDSSSADGTSCEPPYSEVVKTEIISPSEALPEKQMRTAFRVGQDGKWVRVEIKEYPYIIGRDIYSVNYVVDDSKVSRIHAQILCKDDCVYIQDLNSSNGTKVNGEQIDDLVELLSGDEVIIGETKMIFEIGE